MPDKENPSNERTSTLQRIADIKNGVLDPKTLSDEDRQDIVEHLWMTEAQSESIIGHFLKVTDRTVRRDKEKIRIRNAKKLSPEGRSSLLSELMQKLTSTHENLMRLARSKDGSVQENSQSGIYATNSIIEMIKILQTLGYLTMKGQEISVNIHEEEMTPAKLKEELARLEGIASGKNVSDSEVAKFMEEMRYHIAIAEAKERLVKIETKLNDKDSPSA